ncbi:MAG: hypothetical protein GXP28_01590 [Planctomycetes bacterium]|nr:hypothetical protein [Planctomycetota bacterium]
MAAPFHRPVSSETKGYSQIASTVVLLLAVVATPNAKAQRFQSIAPEISVRESKAMRGQATKALRDPAAFQANKKALDNYFTKYYFPSMTLPAKLGELGKRRENLFKQFLRPAKVAAAREHLTDLTLKAMRSIARGNYHPAVRYNAVLILGLLDEKAASTGAGATQPVPLPAAANELLELFEKDEFDQVQVPASLKLGALVGLERHARFGIDRQYADRLTQASLAMIAREEPPADLDPEVHHWMRCQAARVLSRQFAGGPNAQVQAALTGMIADPHMSLDDRCSVAELMKRITYDSAADGDLIATVGALGDLTKAVAGDEAEKADNFQQKMLRSRSDIDELIYERRQLVARLHAIYAGANSLSKGLPGAERQKLQTLLSMLDPVMEIAEDKDAGDLEITPKVIEMESQVRTVVESWKPAKETPAEEAEADFS